MKISPTARQRFDTKYRVDVDTCCWLWTAARMPRGYGIFCLYGNGNFYAHRASWILNRGEIPGGMLVCHRCDRPACVNPEHLFLGTQKDNMQDALQKGRCYIQPRLIHCQRGHAMTDENVYISKGGRSCGQCQVLKVLRNRAKNPTRYLEYQKRYKEKRLAHKGGLDHAG